MTDDAKLPLIDTNDLPLTINVGSIKYYLNERPAVEFLYNNRNEFVKAFNITNDYSGKRKEHILRKYMGPIMHKFVDNEKDELIHILQQRVDKLKSSKEITSSYLKNMKFKRSYAEIQKFIDELKSSEEKEEKEEIDIKGNSWLNSIIPSSRNKKYINSLTDDKKYYLILKLSWMLLNDTNTSWASIVKELDNISLNDFLNTYGEFKKPENNQDKESMKIYIENLIKILNIKKFLNKKPENDSDTNELTRNFNEFENNSKNNIFRYFEEQYSYVYNFLTKTINLYDKNISINSLFSLYKKMNNIYNSKKYGIYKVSNDNLDFINYILVSLKNINDDNFENFRNLPKIKANKLKSMVNINDSESDINSELDMNDSKMVDTIFLSTLPELDIELQDTPFFNKNSLYIFYDKIPRIENIALYDINGKLQTEPFGEKYVNILGGNGYILTDSLLSFIIFIVYIRSK